MNRLLILLLFLPSFLWGQNEAINLDSDTIVGDIHNSAIRVGTIYYDDIYLLETWRFIEAVENDTNPTTLLTFEKTAINTLITRLKAENLWNKFHAIYPFVGNTANSSKYNLKNPRNTDAAYRLTWSAALNSSYFIGGVAPKNMYANTHFKANKLTAKNLHLSWYNRYSISGDQIEIGSFESGGGQAWMQLDNSTNKFYATLGKDNGITGTKNNTDNLGYFIASATDSMKLFDNGTLLTKSKWSESTGYYNDDDIYLFGRNSNSVTADGYTSKSGAFATIGTGLTTEQAQTLTNIVDTFQINMHRNITRDYDLVAIADSGTFSPKTDTNEYLNKYSDFELGGLISYSIYTYAYNVVTPRPSLFTPKDIPVDDWIDGAKDAGVDYLALTILDNSNFALFDNPIPFPDTLVNNFYSYKYYDVAEAESDTSIVTDFVTMCRANNIEPVAYFCPVFDMNFIRIWSGNHGFADWTEREKDIIENWWIATIQYCINRWDFKYVWLDIAYTDGPINDIQKLYNGVKAADSTCMVIGNSIGDVEFGYYPYDIGSNEEYYSLHDGQTWDDVLSFSRDTSEVTYYVPQEVVTNNLVGGAGAAYYRYNDQALRTQSAINAIWDTAYSRGVPFLLNVSPNQDGTIEQAQWDLFKNLPRDVTAPVISSASVADDNRNKIVLVYNESLDTLSTPATTDFSPSLSKTVTDVAISGSQITLTVNADYAYGDLITISYTSGTNKLRDIHNNNAVNLTKYSVVNNISSYTFDTDAGAYITAAGITEDSIKYAVDTFFIQLKDSSLFNKMLAVYPLIGADSLGQKVNAVNPGTYDLTFYGTETFSANGCEFNGSSGYADTKLNPTTAGLTNDSTHWSIYITENVKETAYDIGIMYPNTRYWAMFTRDADYMGANAYAAASGYVFVANTDSRGFFVLSRTASNHLEIYKNNVSKDTETTLAGDLPNSWTIYIGAANNSGKGSNFSSKNFAFASVGKGLSDDDVAKLSSIVNKLMTKLDRNTY